MRNPQGYAQILSPVRSKALFDRLRCVEIGEGLTEIDTFNCVHCSQCIHTIAGDRSADEYFCRNCMARICPSCADYPCMPLIKRIEQEEARDRARRSYMA
jgi:hypothetical protein